MIVMIWAQAHNRVIGKNGTMAWHLPPDMAMFKEATSDHAVVMGRKTWESLAPKYRPLPQRANYVLTRDESYKAEGATVGNDLSKLLLQAETEHPGKIVWVVGGANVYAQALEFADVLVVTEIDLAVADEHTSTNTESCAYAPDFGFDWQLLAASPHRGWHKSKQGIPYRFSTYARKADRENFSSHTGETSFSAGENGLNTSETSSSTDKNGSHTHETGLNTGENSVDLQTATNVRCANELTSATQAEISSFGEQIFEIFEAHKA